jgi:GNAT superfamily N-acetyltransferase
MEQKKEFAIRTARVNDARHIARVQHITWLATYPNQEYGITEADIEWKEFEGPERLGRWERRIRECGEGFMAWVAANPEGDVIGFCTAEKPDHVAVIRTMYVLPEYQGIGVGNQLIAQALAWVGNGIPVSVGVAVYNKKAIAFYEKLGFRNEGEVKTPFTGRLPSGKVIPEVRMAKDAS